MLAPLDKELFDIVQTKQPHAEVANKVRKLLKQGANPSVQGEYNYTALMWVMVRGHQEAASVLEPNVRLAKLNTEEEQMIGARYGIRSITTMILFRKGEEIARQSGAMMAGDIVRWTQAHL